MKQLWKQLIATCLLLVSTITHAGWTVRYQHTDTLGSVIAQSNDQGTISQRFDYKPFGEGTPTQKSGLGYTGHLEDPDLGLTYMQQRYYDPVVGRFYSNDPIGFRDTHSFNRYAYANNNPYKYIDPTGMATKDLGFCGVSGCDFSYKSGESSGRESSGSERKSDSSNAAEKAKGESDISFKAKTKAFVEKGDHTTMITRHDGVPQTLEGRIAEWKYGPAGQLQNAQCGAASVAICGLSIFIGGELPEEVVDTGYYIVDISGEAVDYSEKIWKVPGFISIPVKVFKGSVQFDASTSVCRAACEIRNRRINGGG